MYKYYSKVLVVVFVMIQLQVLSQNPIFPTLSGSSLLQNVVQDYKPFSVLSYGDARDLMYGVIYNENDSVRCVYTGHTLHLPRGVDPSSFLWMSGIADGINAEHTYPRSKGANEDNGNAFSDMHHLFPTRVAVNAARSNFPFGDIEDTQTSAWFYLNQTQNTTPTNNINLYSERISGLFEPREAHKGNVARAVFYFFTMYKEGALRADPDYFERQREVLCDWHHQDPVDSLELDRTYQIARYQSNRPNPFVLDSTLADRSYCDLATSVEEIIPLEISIYPNPVIDWVHIQANGNHQLQVVDVMGQTKIDVAFDEATRIDFSVLPSGIYFIIVDGQRYSVMKR